MCLQSFVPSVAKLEFFFFRNNTAETIGFIGHSGVDEPSSNNFRAIWKGAFRASKGKVSALQVTRQLDVRNTERPLTDEEIGE